MEGLPVDDRLEYFRQYREQNREKVREIGRRSDVKRGHRDRAEYMREYRRRKKLGSDSVE